MKRIYKNLTYLKNSQLDPFEFELLSDITIIIFTKNRKLFLERQIKWWLKFPVKLLILDGSDKDEYLKETFKQNNNINYIKELRVSSRMKIASENITTKYAAISGDDDFYLISALLECIKFLEQNSEFVSCLPQFLDFDVSKKEVLFKNSYLESINFEISSDNVTERVCQKMSPYTVASFYSVQRSSTLINSLKLGIEGDDIEYHRNPKSLLEISIEISTALQGKMSSINQVGYLRSNENFQIDFITRSNITYKDWLTDEYRNERTFWINCFLNIFNNKFSYLELQNILQIAIFKYASQIKSEVSGFNFLSYLREFPGKMIKRLPFILRRIILKLYIMSKHDSRDIIYSYNSRENLALDKNGYLNLEDKKVFERDLQEVSQFVANSSQSL